MKYVPKRIQVTIEPWMYSITNEVHHLSLTMEVRVNDKVVSTRDIKPLEFFVSHFDLVIKSAAREIKDELNKSFKSDGKKDAAA